MIGLLDCNSFYASCERLFRPDLAHRPVAVLSNNDGCIIARTQEAKDLGIPMGAPLFKWRSVLESNNVALFSANFTLYGDISARVMEVIRSECPVVEVYSIDEAFIDLSVVPSRELSQFCRHLRNKVTTWTGIPVCIGVGPSKTLAKLANHVAKKHPRPDGVWYMNGTEKGRLSSLPASEVWGIGSQLSTKLTSMGTNTAWDLRNTETRLARSIGSINMEKTVRELRGERCFEIETGQAARQRIIVSQSFGNPVAEKSELHAALSSFAFRAGEKLRRQDCFTSSMQVFAHTNPFRPDQPRYLGRAAIRLDAPTDDPTLLSSAIGDALDQIYKTGFLYKKAGVLVNEIMPRDVVQQGLFDAASTTSSSQRGAAIDAINQKMGANTVRLAACDLGDRWKMKQSRKSPSLTTDWNNLPSAT